MHRSELLAALRPHLRGALVATDFDGTLAPLVPDPQRSRPAPGAIEALNAVRQCGARVAVVTGRDAETVVRLGGLNAVPGIVVAGLYGLETWIDGVLSSPETPAVIGTLRDRLPSALAAVGADPAVWIEDKRLSLVVHARRADDPQAALALLHAPVARLAAEFDVELHPGSSVLELRLPGFDKGGAIRRLVDEQPPTAALYLGDDLGDLPALSEMRLLRAQGIPAFGVAVLSSGVTEVADAADVQVPDAAAAVELLQALVSPR